MTRRFWNYRCLSLLTVHCLMPIAYCLLPIAYCTAQTSQHKIAIFTPLYLDSAFDNFSNYRYEKQFPKFINPGLEFYEGAQLALDSLQKENARLEVHIYDTRSSSKNIAQILQSPEFERTERKFHSASLFPPGK